MTPQSCLAWVLWTRIRRGLRQPWSRWYAVQVALRRRDISLAGWDNDGPLRRNRIMRGVVAAPKVPR